MPSPRDEPELDDEGEDVARLWPEVLDSAVTRETWPETRGSGTDAQRYDMTRRFLHPGRFRAVLQNVGIDLDQAPLMWRYCTYLFHQELEHGE